MLEGVGVFVGVCVGVVVCVGVGVLVGVALGVCEGKTGTIFEPDPPALALNTNLDISLKIWGLYCSVF